MYIKLCVTSVCVCVSVWSCVHKSKQLFKLCYHTTNLQVFFEQLTNFSTFIICF